MKRLVLVLGIALLAVALVTSGCGGDDEASDDTTTAAETTDATTTGTPTEETPEAGGRELAGSVGPGFEISLFPVGGETASALTPGSYQLTVEDLASAHNFHLTGPGVDVSTSVSEEGTETFTVDLRTGTYEFVCDPHASSMNGSIEVS